MKKRDLTKLALMGVAIGLCGGQIQADDFGDGMMDEQVYAAAQPGYQQGYPQGQQVQRVQPTREQVGNNYPVYDNKGGTTGKGVPVSQGTQAPADHPAGEKPDWNQSGQQPQPQQQMQQAQGQKQASSQGKQYRKNGQTADNSGDAYMNGGCPANNQPSNPQTPNRQNPNSTNR